MRSANKLGQRLLALLDWQTPLSRNDHYASGALHVAHNHLEALIAIRHGLSGV
jgi:hypothetical protein